MAAKTEAQVITQLQEYVALFRVSTDFLEGAFTVQLNSIDTELAVGDRTSITEFQQQSIATLRAQAGNFYGSLLAFLSSISPTLGELAGVPNPGSPFAADLGFFYDYLVDNVKSVKTRGITKTVWVADVGNTGDGYVQQLTTDLAGAEIDVGHPDEGLRMRILQAAGAGVTEGQEPVEIVGTQRDQSWEDEGLGPGDPYEPDIGFALNKIAEDQQRIGGMGLKVTAFDVMSGGSPLNLLTNGDFETAVTGTSTDKYSGVIIRSGETNLTEEASAPIVGLQSMRVTGISKFDFALNTRSIFPKTALSFGAIFNPTEGDALTFTMTVKLIDDDTTHSTIALTEASFTVNQANYNGVSTIVLPAVIGENLRLEFDITAFSASTPATDFLLIDEFYSSRMLQLDEGQFISVHRGETSFELDDIFTSTILDAGTGFTQEFLNRVFGNYQRHADPAVSFTDPVLAPEVQARESDDTAVNDGGTILLGATDTSAQNVIIKWENTGNHPLSFGLPVASALVNCTFDDDGQTTPDIAMPNRTEQVTVVVNPSGAGAFSVLLTYPTNDSSEPTYEITISGTAS